MKSIAIAATMLMFSQVPAEACRLQPGATCATYACSSVPTIDASVVLWQMVVPALQFGGTLAAGMASGLLVCWLIGQALDATCSTAR